MMDSDEKLSHLISQIVIWALGCDGEYTRAVIATHLRAHADLIEKGEFDYVVEDDRRERDTEW